MKNLILGTAVIAIALFSCQKESELAPSEVDENDINVENRVGDIIGDYDSNMVNCVDNEIVDYYLDDILVAPGTFDPVNEDLYTLVDRNEDDSTILIRAYTDIELYFIYGDENGMPLRDYHAFETEMKAYIEANNIIETYEEFGTISEEYYSYEADLTERYFPGSADDRAAITLHKDFSGGAAWIHGRNNPILAPGYNNTVSKHFHFAVYGLVIPYDRAFYRNRFPILRDWGWQLVTYQAVNGLAYLNNRISSLIAI